MQAHCVKAPWGAVIVLFYKKTLLLFFSFSIVESPMHTLNLERTLLFSNTLKGLESHSLELGWNLHTHSVDLDYRRLKSNIHLAISIWILNVITLL